MREFAAVLPIPRLPTRESLLGLLSLYNQSVQALLEGKRETITNADFRFQDGQTVDEKVKRIEDEIKRLVGN